MKRFKNSATEAIYDGAATPAARRSLPIPLHDVARRKIDLLIATTSLVSLSKPPSNHLEILKGDRRGLHSIRINEQYRVCFRWTSDGAYEIEIADYH